MDTPKGSGFILAAMIFLVVMSLPIRGYCQTNQTVSGDDKAVTTPADFSALGDESAIGTDIPTRDDFLGQQEENLPSTGLFTIVVSLGLVLLIFWVIFRFVVRPLMRGAILGRGVDNLRVIASLPIAPTKSVQVVKLVDRLLVIGIAEGGMRLLTEITDPGEVSEMLKALDEKNPAKYHPYKKAFDTMLSRKDETGFEERQKTFNTTLGRLKDEIKTLRGNKSEKD